MPAAKLNIQEFGGPNDVRPYVRDANDIELEKQFIETYLNHGGIPCEVTVSTVDNVWCKQMTFRHKNDFMIGHTHTHDHITLVTTGSFNVVVNGVDSIVKAPQIVFVHKDYNHHLIALEANSTAYCIHALRDYDGGDIIDMDMVPNGVRPKMEPILKRNTGAGKC